jgi:putative phage-type endonuclease
LPGRTYFRIEEVISMTSSLQKQPKPDSKRPALRLVKTNELSRDDWLEVRKTGIGSSDAAAAVGLNPYQSPLELWLVKTGRDARLPKVDPNDDSSPMFWGTLLESFVAAAYTKRTGNRVRKVNAVLQHAQHPWMLANLDREVMGVPDVQILECKTTGMSGQRLWRDGVPEYIQLQVQHQLAVTGKQAADVAVLVCGNDFRTFRIQRDNQMIASLIELERRFWHYVETDTPPPADGSDSAAMALQALYPQDDTTVIQLEDDVEMNAAFSDLLAVRQSLAEAEAFESRLKQRIQERMGHASKAVFSEGEVTWKKSRDGVVLDVATLLLDQPDLLNRYPLERSGSRRFLITS